jgi:alpha-beta hydrolase superfamily lysophospholipase
MKKLLSLVTLIIVCESQLIAQIDFEKMRKQYEKRTEMLDKMVALPTDFGMEFQEIMIKASDSISISAWFIPIKKSKYTMLMVHGFMMNKSNMLQRAKFYSDMGFSILLMDLRARGMSTGERTGGMGKGNIPDIVAVEMYYKNNYKKYGRLIGYGFSHGGRTLIHSAPDLDSMEMLILESTPYSLADGLQRQLNLPERPNFQEEDMDAVLATMPDLPILLMMGDNDTAIIKEEGESLMKHTKAAKSEMIIFPETAHDVFVNKNGNSISQIVKSFVGLKK